MTASSPVLGISRAPMLRRNLRRPGIAQAARSSAFPDQDPMLGSPRPALSGHGGGVSPQLFMYTAFAVTVTGDDGKLSY